MGELGEVVLCGLYVKAGAIIGRGAFAVRANDAKKGRVYIFSFLLTYLLCSCKSDISSQGEFFEYSFAILDPSIFLRM